MSRRGESFLEAASRIGRALVRSAYWDSDHRLCNWVGRSTRERMAVDAPVVPTVDALGPDLYGGSSGVALFLAQLAAVTDDDEASSTAAAACANALRNVERLPVREFPAMSFHSGLIGVAFASHRIVALTGDSHDLATRADATARAGSGGGRDPSRLRRDRRQRGRDPGTPGTGPFAVPAGALRAGNDARRRARRGRGAARRRLVLAPGSDDRAGNRRDAPYRAGARRVGPGTLAAGTPRRNRPRRLPGSRPRCLLL